MQRQDLAIDGDHMAIGVQACGPHLDALQRRVHIAHRAPGRPLLTHHMPGLQGCAQLDVHARSGHVADVREAEGEMRRKPGRLEGKACLIQFRQHVGKVLLDKAGQQEAIVQGGAPTGQALRPVTAVRLTPEPRHQGAQQELLNQAHLRMRRHLERTQLQQSEAPRRPVGRVKLVDAELAAVRVPGGIDQEIAQGAVNDPGRTLPVHRHLPLDLGQPQLDLVDLVGAGLVHARRLTGRPDEQAGEQVGQRRVVVPEGQQAGQQIWPTQEGAVCGRRAPQHEVIAAPRAGVPSIHHELLGRQSGFVRGLVQELGVVHQLRPAGCRMDVDFDDARVRGDLQQLETGVARRWIPLQHDGHAQLLRRRFHGGKQVEVVIQHG